MKTVIAEQSLLSGHNIYIWHPIRHAFPGKFRVLWVLKSCVVSRKIRLGMPQAHVVSRSQKYTSVDFPTVGGNVYWSRTALI